MSQKKAGVMLSYTNMLLNMCISIFFTPFLIKTLGDAEYGVYRTVQSFAGQLSVMTFGVCAIVTRNVAFFDAQKKQREKENFLFMAFCISAVMAVLVGLVGSGLYAATGRMYENSLTPEQIQTAKTLVALFVVNVVVIVLNDGFSGILTGRERFVVARGRKTVRLILRVILLFVLLSMGFKSVVIVATDLVLSVLCFLFDIFYCFAVLKEKVKFHYFDRDMFKTTIVFSCAVFFQAIINQINQNMDGAILGVMMSPEIVTMYSLALTLYTTYNSFSISVSTVFIPQASRMVARDATSEELTDLVAYTGRYSFMFAGLILTGFILFGQEFISIWMSERYLSAYTVALILMIPMTIPLVQNTCECILDAKLKRMSQAIILLATAVINLVLSVLLIPHIGYIGAAIGTAASVVLGNIIGMNIFYQKCIHLDIKRMVAKIFHRLLPCIAGVCLCGVPLRYLNISGVGWLNFVLKVLIYVLVYFAVLYFLGMNATEKGQVNKIFSKVLLRGKKA